MLNLVKPRYVMPFHGDYKRIHLHGQLAEAVGVAAENDLQGRERPAARDRRARRALRRRASAPGMIFVDGVEIGDVADVALRDRRMLSADGIFVVVATISEQDGSSVAEPEVIFRGVPVPRGRRAAARRASAAPSRRRSTRAAKEEIREVDLLQQMLHDDLAELVYERLRRRPMVLPVVVEV